MKKLLFVLAGVAFAWTAVAQELRITHGPYLCDMTHDGVTVVWTTSKPALSWVEASPADSLNAPALRQARYYQTVAGRKLACRTLHAVRVRGLQPGTDYRYRIFSQEVQSWPDVNNVTYGKTLDADASRRRAYEFRTFPQAGSGCSFIVLNDIHGKADYMTRLCKSVDFSKLGFVAFNGDMSSSVESGEQLFKAYLDASVSLFATGTPILFTRGNHETRGVFADSLGDYFPGQDGRFYGIYRYGDVCILLLDCGEDKPDDHAEYNGLADYDAYRTEECEWLKRAVRSDEFLSASARIVLLHIPPMAEAWHGSVHLNELFVPVLNEAGIDLMLCGHDHAYSFRPAGEQGTQFPIVVNDNKSYVRCDVADSLIRVQVVGLREKVAHVHEFPLKRQF
ncbi:FN3 domain-containing metallophosphoesterase family protein [Alistipes sp. D31t1_170403_E11]|uniref:FN3 domain-containing metallophosphoesterase family protein n=1 Tax=Alistipes sp. D31t1_170403_E11 TaxID=2787128 RepID=UPI00189704B7|nr:FN3 domain-containing metallophosphoesterase family protein [Alistipes sp. D31t1_170403_E11]